MNALSPSVLPRPSAELARAVDAAIAGVAVQASIATLPASARREAIRILDAMLDYLRPASLDQWVAFLRPLASMPSGPRSATELDRAAAMFAFALNDIPGVVLTPDHQRTLLRQRFFPNAHEVDEILRPAMLPYQHKRMALRLIAEAPPPAEPQPQEARRGTDGIEAAIAQRFRPPAAPRASAPPPAAPKPPPRASHVTGDQLHQLRAAAPVVMKARQP